MLQASSNIINFISNLYGVDPASGTFTTKPIGCLDYVSSVDIVDIRNSYPDKEVLSGLFNWKLTEPGLLQFNNCIAVAAKQQQVTATEPPFGGDRPLGSVSHVPQSGSGRPQVGPIEPRLRSKRQHDTDDETDTDDEYKPEPSTPVCRRFPAQKTNIRVEPFVQSVSGKARSVTTTRNEEDDGGTGLTTETDVGDDDDDDDDDDDYISPAAIIRTTTAAATTTKPKPKVSARTAQLRKLEKSSFGRRKRRQGKKQATVAAPPMKKRRVGQSYGNKKALMKTQQQSSTESESEESVSSV